MGSAGSYTSNTGGGPVFFTQSLVTWRGASETDVFLIGEPWVRERGFCANSNMTYQTAKQYSWTEIIEGSKHFQREKEKNIWMHQRCQWRQNSLQGKVEQGACVCSQSLTGFMLKQCVWSIHTKETWHGGLSAWIQNGFFTCPTWLWPSNKHARLWCHWNK